MTPVLCFHGRKWFPLKCWLNNSRKVFLWGNKMLHTTVSHHIWKNIQRKMMGALDTENGKSLKCLGMGTLPLQHIDVSPKIPFNVKLCWIYNLLNNLFMKFPSALCPLQVCRCTQFQTLTSNPKTQLAKPHICRRQSPRGDN